ncbi:MAG: hypothetical protein R2867_22900 [Caldilineaceae bacterium]
MPTRMRRLFTPEELATVEFVPALPFTKGMSVLKNPARAWSQVHEFETLLFDLESDPDQQAPLQDAAIEERMIKLMIARMQANDAPPEQYTRLGLEAYVG